MKNELLKGMTSSNIDEVRHAVSRAVDFHNKRRPLMSIDMMASIEVQRCVGPNGNRWRSYREEAILL